MNPAVVLAEAKQKAQAAITGMSEDPWCGFAWVTIRPATGPFVKFLKENGIGHKGYSGGWQVSSYDVCTHRGQSMMVKEAACVAFTMVLRANGIEASVGTRDD